MRRRPHFRTLDPAIRVGDIAYAVDATTVSSSSGGGIVRPAVGRVLAIRNGGGEVVVAMSSTATTRDVEASISASPARNFIVAGVAAGRGMLEGIRSIVGTVTDTVQRVGEAATQREESLRVLRDVMASLPVAGIRPQIANLQPTLLHIDVIEATSQPQANSHLARLLPWLDCDADTAQLGTLADEIASASSDVRLAYVPERQALRVTTLQEVAESGATWWRLGHRAELWINPLVPQRLCLIARPCRLRNIIVSSGMGFVYVWDSSSLVTDSQPPRITLRVDGPTTALYDDIPLREGLVVATSPGVQAHYIYE